MQLRNVATALGNLGHMDSALVAKDGAQIAYRTSETAQAPKRVLVYMNGTAGTADLFDGMGEKLAEKGIKSYSITSRTGREHSLFDAGFRRHADDLDRVVEQARLENPNVPVSVAGTSLGAVIAMHWNATQNAGGARVLALSPVILDRFQPFSDKVKLVGGLFSKRLAKSEVATPMKVGRTMSENPASPYNTRDLSQTIVPVGIFDDVLKMNLDTLAHRGSTAGQVTVVKAGNDKVALNAVTGPFTKASIPGDKRTVTTVPRAAHELSQEWHRQDVVDLFARHAYKAS